MMEPEIKKPTITESDVQAAEAQVILARAKLMQSLQKLHLITMLYGVRN